MTKQSLNRVLNDLIKLKSIEFKKDSQDTMVKHVYLNDKREKIFNEIFSAQKKRIYKALLNSSSSEVIKVLNLASLTAIFSIVTFSAIIFPRDSVSPFSKSLIFVCPPRVAESSSGSRRRLFS